ncbi:hypothetical protein [Desulfonema magnum]|nr:hypothetical protein [Desulfonema magnum]
MLDIDHFVEQAYYALSEDERKDIYERLVADSKRVADSGSEESGTPLHELFYIPFLPQDTELYNGFVVGFWNRLAEEFSEN